MVRTSQSLQDLDGNAKESEITAISEALFNYAVQLTRCDGGGGEREGVVCVCGG